MKEKQRGLFTLGAAEKPQSSHLCHWPGCRTPTDPKMWGCKHHWFRLPKELRDRIWATYRPGQEVDKEPSAEYWEAALAVQRWIKKNGTEPPTEEPIR